MGYVKTPPDHKIATFAFTIVSCLFYDRGCQGGLLKVMESRYFLVFLAVWVIFPRFSGRLRSGLC